MTDKQGRRGQIPFAFAGVLFDDGLARFNLSKADSPRLKIFISSVWHETANVDVGDAFRVLQALRQADFLLVGPQRWYGAGDAWVLLGEIVEVNHFVGLVVSTLHWLDGTCNVLLGGGSHGWVLLVAIVVVDVSCCCCHTRSDRSDLFVGRPRSTTGFFKGREVCWNAVWPIVALHGSGIQAGIVDEAGKHASGYIWKSPSLCSRGLLAVECRHGNSLSRWQNHERLVVARTGHALAVGITRRWEIGLKVLHVA